MAVPVIESYTDVSHTGTSFDVTKPTGLAVGDLLLAIIAKDDDITMAPPAGWTTDFDGSGNASQACASFAFHKVADADDVAASVFNFTGDNEDYVGRLYRISGVDTTTPIDAVDATGTVGTTATPQAVAITTQTDDALCFAFTGMDDNDVPYTLETAGWTVDVNTDNTTTGIVIARKSLASAGTTGAVDFTTNASDGWVASQIAIRPFVEVGDVTIEPGSGSIAVTGQAVTVVNNVDVDVANATATLVGQVPEIKIFVNISSGFATVTANGFVPNIDLPVEVLPDVASLTISGQVPVSSLPIYTSPDATIVDVSGNIPVVDLPVNVSPDAVSLTMSGNVPVISLPISDDIIPIDNAILTIAGKSPYVEAFADEFCYLIDESGNYLVDESGNYLIIDVISIASAALAISGYAPTISISAGAVDIEIESASVFFAGKTPVIVSSDIEEGVCYLIDESGNYLLDESGNYLICDVIAPPTASLGIAGLAPTIVNVSTGATVSIGSVSLAVTGQEVTVENNVSIAITAVALTVAGQDVITEISADVTVQISPASLTVTGQDVTENNPVGVDTSQGALIVSGQSVTVIESVNTSADPGAITVTGKAPDIENPVLIEVPTGTTIITGYTPNIYQYYSMTDGRVFACFDSSVPACVFSATYPEITFAATAPAVIFDTEETPCQIS